MQPLLFLLIANRLARGKTRAAKPLPVPPSPSPDPSAKDAAMPSEFDFLDKHFCESDEPYNAAQAAHERFGNYPAARTSTVIYGMKWDTLINDISNAVINYAYGTIFNSNSFAALSQYNGNPQWNIILTGVKYVNAEKGNAGVKIYNYTNGSVIINARVVGDNPPGLGDIVHLQAAVGTCAGEVPLKN
jgi:hypothetical protein